MAFCINSLREELEHSKKELQNMKAKEFLIQRIDPDIEDFKFIENPTKVQIRTPEEEYDSANELQKKRYVKFASPPSLAQVIVNKDDQSPNKPNSMKKVLKKKSALPLLGWLFPKKKGVQESGSPRI